MFRNLTCGKNGTKSTEDDPKYGRLKFLGCYLRENAVLG